MFKIIEKNNENAVHGVFSNYKNAVHHLNEKIPEYVSQGFFMDKTLTKDSFKIIPAK